MVCATRVCVTLMRCKIGTTVISVVALKRVLPTKLALSVHILPVQSPLRMAITVKLFPNYLALKIAKSLC